MMITELCELGFKYGTDKCHLKHNYTPIYYDLLKDKRESIKKVLEFGIGYYPKIGNDPIVYDRGLRRYYHRGASLKMWRDFLPNAHIYGVDYQPDAMFEDDRITTFVCDTRDKEGIERLLQIIGTDLDFVVDDGSHRYKDQMVLVNMLMPELDDKVLYIIEDVNPNCIDNAVYSLGQLYSARAMFPSPKKHKDSSLLVVEKYA